MIMVQYVDIIFQRSQSVFYSLFEKRTKQKKKKKQRNKQNNQRTEQTNKQNERKTPPVTVRSQGIFQIYFTFATSSSG